MKLIEADKVEQAINDYWKAQVDKALTLTDGNEKRITIYLEHNHELLKAIDELPSAEPESISKWKKEFREYVDSLNIVRDDWKGIIEYIDELPSIQPDPCEDAVSREAVLSMIDTYMNKSVELHYLPTSDGIKKLISILPSAQPERKTGHWVKTARWGRVYYCDQCRNYLDFDGVNAGRGSTNFCPNCGAKMERGEK